MESVGSSNDISYSKKRSGNVTLVFGILSVITSFVGIGFLLGIVGLIFGVIDLVKKKRYKQHRKGKTWAGIVCCVIGIIATLIFSIVATNMALS